MDENATSTVATTTCSYSNPVMFDGNPPASSLDYFQFASSTCATIQPYATSSPIEFDFVPDPENPLFVQDSGNLTFGLALILFVLVFTALGSIFTSRSKK